MSNRDPQWRAKATDCDLFEHLHRTFDRIREHLYTVDNIPSTSADTHWVKTLVTAAEDTANELALRTDRRELMDGTQPAEPQVADPLLDLIRDIDDAEARGDVTPEGGVILRPVDPAALTTAEILSTSVDELNGLRRGDRIMTRTGSRVRVVLDLSRANTPEELAELSRRADAAGGNGPLGQRFDRVRHRVERDGKLVGPIGSSRPADVTRLDRI